jgi:AraC-like DNA-binding protein
MLHGTLPLQSGYRIIQIREREELCAFLHGIGINLDVGAKDAEPLKVCFNSVPLPGGMAISFVDYGTNASVQITEANRDYWIVPPLRGDLEIVVGKRATVCGPGRAFVNSPRRANRIRSAKGSSRLSLRLNGDALTRQLSALLGEPLGAPLELATELNLAEGYGRSIAGYLQQAIADFEIGSSVLGNAIAANAFVQFIMTALLLSHPHNYSAALQRLDKPVAPRDVKRALDYIEGHLESVISLGDIVAAAGVPGRTLFRHFIDCRGVSPMRYLRMARLQKAREELLHAKPEQDVSVIAMRWGFEHLGRFAAEYRKRFGERPSETLKARPARGSDAVVNRVEKRAARTHDDAG